MPFAMVSNGYFTMIGRRQFNQSLLALASLVTLGLNVEAKDSSRIITKTIPSSGQKIPAIGMGTWITFDVDKNIDELKQHIAILVEFFHQGGSMIDSSPMYGMAQKILGITLPLTQNKEKLFSATKVWIPGQHNGIAQMLNSATVWGINKFDLIYIHNMLDWRAHLPTLQQWKAEKKLRYIGMTASHGRRHSEMLDVLTNHKLDFIQVSYNIHDRDVEEYLLPMAQEKGVAVVANRPFQTNGLFSRVRNKKLPDWASEIDCNNWAQFFLKFVISHPALICAIPATSQLKHMQQNMGALYGRLPDKAMRTEMVKYYQSVI